MKVLTLLYLINFCLFVCFSFIFVWQLLNVPMLASWAIFYFAKDISHIYIALCLSGISGGLLEAPVSLTSFLCFLFRFIDS